MERGEGEVRRTVDADDGGQVGHKKSWEELREGSRHWEGGGGSLLKGKSGVWIRIPPHL